jgi:hypothetical protein
LFRIALPAAAQDISLPATALSVDVDGHPVSVSVSGTLVRAASAHGSEVFRVALNAGMSDLQDKLTSILQAELNQDNRCGDRISVERASLVPAPPAGDLTANLHYEKWACIKAFHKEMPKRLAGGNAVVPVRLTPEADGRTFRLAAAVGDIQADGSIGELLRQPELYDALQAKIAKALDRLNLQAAVPPALADLVTVQSVDFVDAGAGRLALDIHGTVAIPSRDAGALLHRLSSPSLAN